MKCIIIINAFADTANALYQPERLKTELEKLRVEIEIIKNDGSLCSISNNIIRCNVECDFCIFLDKDKYLLLALEKCGIKLFNPRRAILDCDDKVETFLRLANEGIPLPETIPAPLCYTPTADFSEKYFDDLVSRLGLPMIIKTSYGSLGSGVFLVKNRTELENASRRLKQTPHLYQKFIRSSYGRDVRAIVVGGKFLGAILRRSKGDFRSNLSVGGDAEVYPPTPQLISLTEKIASILKLDYCGIDLLLDGDGYTVCEVNSNAFFSGFEKTTKINVAEAYCKHILSTLNNRI